MAHLLANGCPATTLGLLVGLGEGSVAGANALAGGIVNLTTHPVPRAVTHRGGEGEFFDPQERLELGKEFREFPFKE